MTPNEAIAFVAALLEKLHMATTVLENPVQSMPNRIDGGLRAMLFGESDYTRLLVNSPSQASPNVIYRFYDEYACYYIFFKIPNSPTNACFYIGPYLLALPSEAFINKKTEQLSLSESQAEQLRAYYRHLPIVEDENVLITIVDTLGAQIWNGEENFNVEFINYEIPDRRRPIVHDGIFENNDASAPALSLDRIEQNYQNEQKLIEAVSKGKLNQVDIITSSVLHQGTEERLPDSLRNRKNYLIILNTLLRKAAQRGEVHPYHIHRLSSDFAAKIEALYSIENSLTLQKEMIRKYCLLVKEYSLKKYSHLIGRVITLISYDLSAPLSLKQIAAAMNVNASYLSALFKKECGETLTDYVNRKRMEQAAYILTHSDKQVQIVAEECGILDTNYFIKIFKKYHGTTPTAFRSRQ